VVGARRTTAKVSFGCRYIGDENVTVVGTDASSETLICDGSRET
jgi:hypothetical protein